MKKQINPTIKAHLIRSAFYLLLLLAVCAIPFALAQRAGRSTTRLNSAKVNNSKLKPAVSKETAAANAAKFSMTARGADPATTETSRAQLAARFAVDARNFSAVPGSKVSTKQPAGTSGTLWYNGEFNGINGLANEDNTS